MYHPIDGQTNCPFLPDFGQPSRDAGMCHMMHFSSLFLQRLENTFIKKSWRTIFKKLCFRMFMCKISHRNVKMVKMCLKVKYRIIIIYFIMFSKLGVIFTFQISNHISCFSHIMLSHDKMKMASFCYPVWLRTSKRHTILVCSYANNTAVLYILHVCVFRLLTGSSPRLIIFRWKWTICLSVICFFAWIFRSCWYIS